MTSDHLASFYFKISLSFFLKPCFSNLFSLSFLSWVKKVYFKRSSGTVLDSPAITLFKSNMKKGVLGISYLARCGLFLSLISSRLKMAYHFEYGWSLSPRYFELKRVWSRDYVYLSAPLNYSSIKVLVNSSASLAS